MSGLNSRHVASLIAAHFNGQDALFRTHAAELVKQMPESAARNVRYLLERKTLELVNFNGLPPGTVRAAHPTAKLDSLVLSARVRCVLGEVLEEVRSAEELLAAGLAPATSLLLAGPPGTGKTSTASALAAELGVPLYCVNLESLIDSHLGETGKKVRSAFEAASAHEGVWLFDEFDVLGWSRSGDSGDVGEVRRVVNAVLAAMDARSAEAKPRNLLVCATNRADDLDAAVLRRFEHCLTLGLPDAQERAALLSLYLGGAVPGDLRHLSEEASAGLSHAAVARACARHRKAGVLGRDLTLRSALAEEDAAGGRRFTHYKGGEVEVLGTATHSESLERYVVYRALYECRTGGLGSLWVRPEEMFRNSLPSGEPRFSEVRSVPGRRGAR